MSLSVAGVRGTANMMDRTILGSVAGFGVALAIISGGLILPGLPGRDVLHIGSVVGVGFALAVLVFVLSRSVWRLRGQELSVGSSVLLGVASGAVATVAVAYVFEGFEQGVFSLLADPVFRLWLVGLALGGGCLGWLCRASSSSRA